MNTANLQSHRPQRFVTPPVDIFESDDEFRIVADLPGVKADGLTLDIERGELTLVAQRFAPAVEDESESSDESAAEETSATAAASPQSTYRRVFRVPDEVESAAVEASLTDGVLEVRLPKSERGRPRRIAINAAS